MRMKIGLLEAIRASKQEDKISKLLKKNNF